MSYEKYEFDHFREIISYLKHITALSTGSIVIVASFMSDVFQNPVWVPAIVTSISGFVVAVISSTVGYTIMITFQSPAYGDSTGPAWVETASSIILVAIWLSFTLDILSLGIFFVVNLLH